MSSKEKQNNITLKGDKHSPRWKYLLKLVEDKSMSERFREMMMRDIKRLERKLTPEELKKYNEKYKD